ncbi:hypothetical protein GCM10020254_47760 [Streptomyces goshikiensis]
MDEREPGGLLGQLGGVGLAADLGGGEGAAAGDDEGAGHDGVAGLLQDGVGLAGEQGLVDLQAVGLADGAVDDDLVAGAEFDDVVEDDLGGGDLGGRAVAADAGFGLADDGEAVQGLLGAQLLDDADAGVGDDHVAEEAVLDRRDDEHDHPQDADDGVEPGEDVGADDVGGRAAAADGDVVDVAAGDALGDLGSAQPAGPEPRRGRPDGVYGVELGSGVDGAGAAAGLGPVGSVGFDLRPLRHAFDVKGARGASPAEMSEYPTSG